MKATKRFLGLLLTLSMLLSLLPKSTLAANVANSTSDDTSVGNNFSILPAGEIFLKVGESLELELANLPVGGTEEDVTWEYSDEYLSMSGNTITANAPGVINITAKITLEDKIIASDSRDVIIYALAGVCGAEGDGSDVSWKIDPDSNTLTISGNGPMQDYISTYSISGTEYNSAPWYPYCRFTRGNNPTGVELTVTVTDGVTSIGNYAFSTEFDTIYATKVELPDSITRLGKHTGIKYLSSLPKNLEVLDDEALYGTTFLNNSVYIPGSVRSVGNYAFYSTTWPNTPNLDAAFFYGDAPERFGENVFCDSKAFTIYYIVGTGGWTDSDAYDAVAGTWNGYKLEPWSSASGVASIKGFYPGNNAQIEKLEQSMIRIGFDREVLSGQVRNNYADLDFSKTPLAIYRARDNQLIYQVKETNSEGISFDVTSYSSSPTEVNIRIINAESLFTPGNTYYVTMGAGFIKFADGTVSPEIKKGDWSFTTSYYSKTIDIQMNTGAENGSFNISTLWDESWFTNPATTYMHDLAITSMVLSGAAYNEQSIKSALHDLGFTGSNSSEIYTNNYHYPLTENDNDIVAYAFAHKTAYDKNRIPYTLIAIIVKGTSSNEEWYSNFNVGTGSTHEGFQTASQDLLTHLAEYQEKLGINGQNIKYLVTGHSRGAAVANLVAAELTNSPGTQKENVYAYTFATPTVSEVAAKLGFENIFNIVNGEDFVTRVPLEKWQYHRYGIDLLLPSRSYYSSNSYNTIIHKMESLFNVITGEEYDSYTGTTRVDNAVNAMYSLASSVDAYYNKYYIAINDGVELSATTYDYFRNLSKAIIGETPNPLLLASASFAPLTAFFIDNHLIHPRIFSAHSQATYYSWLKTSSAEELFGADNTSSYETFKRLTIACPVDVYVYNETGMLVASVVNESVETNILATNLSDGVKTIDLPGDQTYSIKIVAYDSGTVDYTIEELAAKATGTDVLRTVEFYKIPIELSDELTGTIDEAHSIESSQYALTKNDQDKIYADYDSAQQGNSSSGGSISSTPTRYTINLADDISGGVIRISKTKAAKGEKITVTARPDADYELDSLAVITRAGKDVELTSTISGEYTFVMPASDVTVEATFMPAEENNSAYSFLDVDSTAWYYDAVKYVVENGIMSGTGTYTFEPNTTLSRGMIAQMLYALEGKPNVSVTGYFNDVPVNAWFAKAAAWAQSKGIITGYDNGNFGPNDPLTREQLALILYNYAKTKEYSTSAAGNLSQFIDGRSTSAWAQEGMTWAVGAGLLSGRDGNMLCATGTATRSEVAQIMMNFCKNVAG